MTSTDREVPLAISPDFVSMFKNDPRAATTLMRRLYSANGETQAMFLMAFPVLDWRSPQDAPIFEACITAGFPTLLSEMFSGEPWYTAIPQGNSRLDESFWAYLHPRTASIIVDFLRFIDHPGQKHLVAATTIVQNLYDAWEGMWRHRTILGLYVDTKIFPIILELLGRHSGLCDILGDRNSVRKSGIRRISFYLWIKIAETDIPYTHEYVHRLCNVVIQPGPVPRDDYYAEVMELVFNNTDIGDLFCKILQDPELVNDKLADVLYILIWMCTSHLPAMQAFRNQPTHNRSVLSAVSEAFQRHVCLGDLEECPKDGVFKATWETLYIMLYEGSGLLSETEIEANIRDLNFIPAIAGAISWLCCMNNHEAYIQAMVSLQVLTKFGMKAKSSTQSALRSDYLYLRRLLRLYWLPTLTALQEAHVPPDKLARARAFLQSVNYPLPRDPLRHGIAQWIALGRAFELEEHDERSSPSFTEDISEMIPSDRQWLGCFSKACPCFGRRPQHRTRRVCTGCFVVFYCGPRCQTRDWNAGHRELCPGRKRP